MGPADDPRADAAAFDFLEQLRADRAAGTVRSLAEYLARFPEFELRIAREFVAACAGAELAVAAPADEPGDGEFIAGYRVVRLLGRGGQGRVYLAEELQLQRLVALKVLDQPVVGVAAARIERLRREAAALARLDHPGVCAIYAADAAGERPFLAMRYVPGETLQARLHRAAAAPASRDELLDRLPRSAADIRRVLHLFERAARALDAAHEAGVVHRDVKPANIMIDRDGLPVLLDFGLARMIEDAGGTLTLTGEVFGTLAYMSPEQLEGGVAVDGRTDIYSLGVSLYECLTFELPFRKDTRQVLDRDIRVGAARNPLAFNPHLPRDVCVVIATAMERDRTRRYATAWALADDLANAAANRPIQARPAGALLRLHRWSQRHPALAGTAALLLLLLVVTITVAWQLERQNRRLEAWQTVTGLVRSSHDRPAEALARLVDAARDESDPRIREALHEVLLRCHEAWRRPLLVDDPAPDRVPALWPNETLSGATLLADAERRRCFMGTTWGHVFAFDIATGAVVGRFRAHDSPVTAMALSPDGRRMVTGSYYGQLRVWPTDDLGPGEPLATRQCVARIWQLAYDPRGDRLAVAAQRAPDPDPAVDIAVFDVDADGVPVARPRWQEPGHDGRVWHLGFAPDGAQLLSFGEDPRSGGLMSQQLFVRDADRGTQRLALASRSRKDDIGWACWTAGGRSLCVARLDGRLQSFEGADSVPARARHLPEMALWVGLMPSGKQLLVGAFDGLWIVDAGTLVGDRVVTSTLERSYQHARFSPDGEYVAVAVRDSSIRVFEVRTWCEVAVLRQHEAYVDGILWSADGRHLLSVDHLLMHGWSHLARPFLRDLRGHSGRVVQVDFSPDAGTVATAGEDGTVRLWDASTARATAVIPLPAPRSHVRFAPSGASVVTVGAVADAHVVPVEAPDRVTALVGHTGVVTDAWICEVAGIERVVTISEDGSARLWALDGECLRRIDAATAPLRCGAIDPRRGWLAVGGEDRRVHLFDLASGAAVADLGSERDDSFYGINGTLQSVAFLPRSQRVAATGEETALTVWDPAKGWSRAEVLIGGSTGWMATDADESRILVGELSIGRLSWISADLTEPVRFPESEPPSWISRIAVRAAGDIGLVACRDGSVWLYQWQARRPYSVLRAGRGAALDACFSPDGRWIAVAYRDGTALVWPVEPWPAAARYRLPMQR
ncbi:MAG: protein kinase [Planctomycetota bacterium]